MLQQYGLAVRLTDHVELLAPLWTAATYKALHNRLLQPDVGFDSASAAAPGYDLLVRSSPTLSYCRFLTFSPTLSPAAAPGYHLVRYLQPKSPT